MPKAQTVIDFVFGIVTLVSLVGSAFFPISLEPQYIPTAVNGITSSISIILGLTVAAITIAISQAASFKMTEDTRRIEITVFLLVCSVIILNGTYGTLAGARLEEAFRWAMFGLQFSVYLLMDFIVFLVVKMQAVRLSKSIR